MQIRLSFSRLFALATVCAAALLSASLLSAWSGPTATAPGGNVAAPINVGTTDQVKDAGISVNSLAVFGSQYIENKLGIGRVSPIVALDVNGTLRLGDGGEQCQAVSAGSVRYVSNLNALQYCDGSAWTSLGGSGGNLSAIRTFTSGTNVSYTPGDGVSRIVVEVWGGGGGGGAHNYYPGNSGGTTCFGTNATACSSPIVSATGGGGGGVGSNPTGAGGSGSGGDINLTGGPGGTTGSYTAGDPQQTFVVGGVGGSAPRGGGGGAGAVFTVNYFQAPHGSAFGGGGSGESSNGGGGGGYAMKLITSPAASYTYTIGAGGAGAGSVSYYGFAGGNGGSGGIVIYEYSE